MIRGWRHILLLLTFVMLSVAPALAQPAGTMTFAVHVTLATRWLDPAETDAEITPFMIFYALHDALVKPMPASLNAPSLAESWTMSKDGRVWKFVLRRGACFHNGDPVTSDDVKFSFERYRAAAAVLKELVREVQVVDPGRVRFHLKDPWPDFMTFYGASASRAAWIILGERVHSRIRAARRGGGADPDPRLPLLGAARGTPAEAITVERRFPWHAPTM